MARRSQRRKRNFQRRTEPGAPPGMLVPDPNAARTQMHVLTFGPDGFTETRCTSTDEIRPLVQRGPMTWVNVEGLSDTSLIGELGALFGLHRLALEDVVHPHQRAKVEQYADSVFIVARMPRPDATCQTEQIAMFLGANFLITFQEDPGDCLEAVRIRIRTGMNRIRTSGSGYLAYALLDAIIDQYFPKIEDCADRLDKLEDMISECINPGFMQQLLRVRRDLLHVRRAVWPLRDALNVLMRDPCPFIDADTRLYLRDCHDHTIQIIDLVESLREVGSGLAEFYLSMLGYRTNEVMKVLTIISTIFIPLTFVVGVYGMNFDTQHPWNMPELSWPHGYLMVMAAMAVMAVGLLALFWRMGWLGRERVPRELMRPGTEG